MRSKTERKGKSVASKGKAKGGAPIASASSRLLTLPPELRLLIYDTYFSSPSYGKRFPKTGPFDGYTVDGVDASLISALTDRFRPAKDGDESQRTRSNINLLSVCRLVHSEALPRFYHHHLFQLPTCFDLPPSLAAMLKEPNSISSTAFTHFDLIHRLEVVHHNLGNTIVDRQDTDFAIADLLEMINNSCPSLRCLSIRVICDLHDEMDYFEDMSMWAVYPYLDFVRKTPGMLAALMPQLRELAIILVDSKPRHAPGHPEWPPTVFKGTWTWHVDDSEIAAGAGNDEGGKNKDKKGREENEEGEGDEEGEEGQENEKGTGASMKKWGERFFTRRPGSLSEVPSMDEVRRDSLYQIASLEPFEHWYDPEAA